MLEFQQDNQFFLLISQKNQQRPFPFFESAFGKNNNVLLVQQKDAAQPTSSIQEIFWCKHCPSSLLSRVVYGESATKIAIVFNHLLKLVAWQNFSFKSTPSSWCSRTQTDWLRVLKRQIRYLLPSRYLD